MCGIVGSIGFKNSGLALMAGLSRLEYRGYDSAGLYLKENQQLYHAVGPLKELKKKLPTKLLGNLGIGHTRWATHGKPTLENTHPFLSQDGRFVLVHNGTIENYRELKDKYLKDLTLNGQTDSEVVVNLIAFFDQKLKNPFLSLQKVMSLLEGSYALAVIPTFEEDMLLGAKKDSPLVIGENSDGYFVTSDPSAAPFEDLSFTEVEDGDLFVIKNQKLYFAKAKPRRKFTLDETDQFEDKGKFKSFMEKEIQEENRVVENILQNYLIEKKYLSDDLLSLIQRTKHLYFVACGTSYHASLVGKRYFENFLKIPTQTFLASELNEELPLVEDKPLFIFLTQSGETADSLKVLKNVLKAGYPTVVMTNVVHSTMARMSDFVLPLLAGKEVAVASTKAYVAQMAVLLAVVIRLKSDLQEDLRQLPEKMRQVLNQSSSFVEKVLPFLKEKGSLTFIGRHYDWDVSLEGALKIKEIAYLQAQGYAAGELKHGPIALIEEGTPMIALMSDGKDASLTKGNILEVESRGGVVFTIGTKNSNDECDLTLPNVKSYLQPFLTILPLQLLALRSAEKFNYSVDQPKNLAKSVTVQ